MNSWLGVLNIHGVGLWVLALGFVVGVYGWQDSGKTLFMVAKALDLARRYRFDGYVGNLRMGLPGFLALDMLGMRGYMRRAVEEELTNRLVLIDEIDRVFPARFWSDKKQSEALIGLWQDEKMGNVVIYTAHLGASVDLLVRQSTWMVVLTEFDRALDVVHLEVSDRRNDEDYSMDLVGASEIFDKYNRWEIIHLGRKVCVRDPAHGVYSSVSKFCPECGAGVVEIATEPGVVVCGKCGEHHKSGDRFCSSCGAILGVVGGSTGATGAVHYGSRRLTNE